MPRHELDTLSEVMQQLKEEGYKELNFNGSAMTTGDKTFRAHELTIEDEYRFEGHTYPDDQSILYAVKASDGTKGIIINSYGPDANLEIHEFMQQANDNTNSAN